MKERLNFEKWATNENYDLTLLPFEVEYGEYDNDLTQSAWDVWQACSRSLFSDEANLKHDLDRTMDASTELLERIKALELALQHMQKYGYGTQRYNGGCL